MFWLFELPFALLVTLVRRVRQTEVAFWFIELPALIVSLYFLAWRIFLAVLTLVMFTLVLHMLLAAWLGWPVPYLPPSASPTS